MHWFPSAPGSKQMSDMYVVGATDGCFYMCTRKGKVEKVVVAHTGALLALKWNHEGTALVTAGEDGVVKIWSKSAMLRSQLVQSGYPVYSCVWAPDNNQILYTNGRNLVIKHLQPANKPTQVLLYS